MYGYGRGYGGGMYGANRYGGMGGPRRNGPSGGQVIFLIILLLIFAGWWYYGGGQQDHAKYTAAQNNSAKTELKKKANHDERINSSEIDQQNGQQDGTTSADSDNIQNLNNLANKFSKKKYPNYIANLGSATFSDENLNNANMKQMGHAWYQLTGHDGINNYGQAYINSKALSESNNFKFDNNKTYLIPPKMMGVMSNNNLPLNNNDNITNATSNAHKAINSINDKVQNYLSQPNKDIYYTIEVINSNDKISGYHIMIKSVSDYGQSLNINDFVFNK